MHARPLLFRSWPPMPFIVFLSTLVFIGTMPRSLG